MDTLGRHLIAEYYGCNAVTLDDVDAVGAHDYNVTQTLVMLVVLVFVVVNLAIDIIYGWLDPRIRYS